LRAKAGNCRFKLIPPDGGVSDAVIHVAGLLDSTVSANTEGQALRDIIRLKDGSALFILPGLVDGPRWVEVAGAVPLLGD
ncbi:MAG: hypothetical protein K8R91_02470, partial [Phycisphaerae bacterium]|nr:hypothetical protein [Phycisphaerae bacterium]